LLQQPAAELEPATLSVPVPAHVDVQVAPPRWRPTGPSAALTIMATLLCIYTLHWAAAVCIPVLFSVIFNYALSPVVTRLARWRLPRWLGAALVVSSIVGGLGWTGYALADDASQLMESLPEAAQKLRQTLKARHSNEPGALERVQKAAAQLEQAADENALTASAANTKGVLMVQTVKPKFNVKDYVWTGTLGLLGLGGQAAAVCLLTYFLLASGTNFRRKMVRLAGPTLTHKKVTVQALDEVVRQVQRYLMVQLVLSAIVGLTTGLAFWAAGLQHAAVWGLVAAVCNLVPYVGTVVVTGGAALVALMQLGTLESTLLIAGLSLGIRFITGQLLAPWLTSRTSRLNPVAVFIGILFWGWLWGVWGMLLGVPILMIVKVFCDSVKGLHPAGELLGN